MPWIPIVTIPNPHHLHIHPARPIPPSRSILSPHQLGTHCPRPKTVNPIPTPRPPLLPRPYRCRTGHTPRVKPPGLFHRPRRRLQRELPPAVEVGVRSGVVAGFEEEVVDEPWERAAGDREGGAAGVGLGGRIDVGGGDEGCLGEGGGGEDGACEGWGGRGVGRVGGGKGALPGKTGRRGVTGEDSGVGALLGEGAGRARDGSGVRGEGEGVDAESGGWES
jgi:hypothetical protein